MSDAVLAAENVHRDFGDAGVVEGADLRLREGEILALVGPNGVGKSVLLSCLAGSLRPSAGSVSLPNAAPDEHVGESLAIMHQEAVSVETLTGRENVAHLRKLHPAFSDRWETYAERLEIAAALDRRVDEYSGGMRRKLEFALTMSVDVPIYLLDEPTAGVDLAMVRRVHDVILERNAAGASVLLSTHRPMDVDLADRVAVMPDGRITATGTPDDLLAGVPPTVRITGTDAFDRARSWVRDGQLFTVGGEARGFLRDEVSVEEVAARLDGAVERTEPTYADLFNYYVHVRS